MQAIEIKKMSSIWGYLLRFNYVDVFSFQKVFFTFYKAHFQEVFICMYFINLFHALLPDYRYLTCEGLKETRRNVWIPK